MLVFNWREGDYIKSLVSIIMVLMLFCRLAIGKLDRLRIVKEMGAVQGVEMFNVKNSRYTCKAYLIHTK